MNITKNIQMKLTIIVFILLIALLFSGVVSAVAVSNQPAGSHVVETQENFYDSTAIQDAIDDDDTVNGNNIQIDPAVHFEQVTVTKNITLTGMGTTPEKTVIVSSGGAVIIPSGVSAVLENLAIWDINNDQAIINNGRLTLINCMVNGTYVANEVTGIAAGDTVDSTGANVPIITSLDPVNESVNIPPNKVINITFSEPILIGTGAIELKNSTGTVIPITTAISGNFLTITPALLLTTGKYILTLQTGSVTNLAGNNLSAYITSFTVDSTPPSVTTTDPVGNAVNVSTSSVMTVTFSEAVKVGNMWIELFNSVGTKTLVPITMSISGNVLTINHAALLAKGTKYTLALHTGSLTDLVGNSLVGVANYFTTISDATAPTVTSSDPVNNAVNVSTSSVMTVTFSEAVKVGNMWIELFNSVGTKTLIPITMSISGNVLTINHAALLAKGTKYTLALHTGSLTDLVGNSLVGVANYFTTISDATAPTVTSSDPVNNAVNVSTSSVMTVTFSEPVKWGTSWIELISNGTVVPITMSLVGNVLTITPLALLVDDTKYIICLHTGSVTNYNGIPLAGVAKFFTTGNN